MTSERPDLLGSVLAFLCVAAALATMAPRSERHRERAMRANVPAKGEVVLIAQAFAEPHLRLQ